MFLERHGPHRLMTTSEDKTMNKIKIFLFFICFGFFINPSLSLQELDRIIAIVNKEPITLLDLQDGINRAKLYFKQNNIQAPSDSVIQKKVLDELIEKKIIESYASDWNIKATSEDVDSVIKNILISNKITLDQFKENLDEQGSSYNDFVKNLKYEILLKKVKNQEISSRLNISSFEVQKHKEKLAKISPEIFNLSHILLKFPPDPSSKQKQETRDLGKKIYQKLINSEFEKVAYEFSDAPDANQGGLLGNLNKNELPEIFISQLEKLKSGEISEPFESNNGIHIIKINYTQSPFENNMPNKEIKKYYLRQILIKTSEIQSENDVKKKLNKIREEIQNGGDFETLAKKYSEDFSSINGGAIGWFSEGIDKKIEIELSKIDKNEISAPFQTNNGWLIIQYTDTKIEDMKSEKIDNQIKLDLIDERTELLFEDWIASLRAESFIEIRGE